ncbi:MAG: fibronectin type III domain-containing protein [Eubacterium sp.]|nr:fibronectin type III domain-containing protein [Eubacterium sp.]
MVTKNYKGVNTIRHFKIKVVSVALAALFCFSGAAIAYAEEPTNSYANAPGGTAAEVQSEFDIISSIENAEQEKNDFSIKVSNVNATNAVLSWSSSDLYISYRICRFNIIQNKWEDVIYTPNTELKLTDLKENTNYKYCIINAATDELLGVTEFTTALNKPTIEISERNGNSVELEVSNVQKGAKVELYRKKKGKKYKKIATLSSDDTSYTDKKLKGATTYYYKAKTVATGKEDGQTVTKNSGYSKATKAKTLKKMGLPSVSGRTKTYAIYTAVTLKSSPQYKLLRSKKCYTDKKTGIRMVDGCYCVALGSYYGTKIGTKYKITFSTGKEINVILCDQKADRHTDSKHQYAVNNSDIIEFYVEKSKMPRKIRNLGNYGVLDEFKGSVVSIEKYV